MMKLGTTSGVAPVISQPKLADGASALKRPETSAKVAIPQSTDQFVSGTADRNAYAKLGLLGGVSTAAGTVPVQSTATVDALHIGATEVGSVKWFNAEEGKGFLTLRDGSELFVQTPNIPIGLARTLEPGQKLEFQVGQGPKGPEAFNVKAVGVDTSTPVPSEPDISTDVQPATPAGPVQGSAVGTTQVGSVKWFSAEEGHGFLTLPDGSDLFVQASNIPADLARTLQPGQQLEFDVAQGPKGPEAINVRVA
jgi:CspA family cold shock protein